MSGNPGLSTVRPGAKWTQSGNYQDIEYHTAEGIARLTINRPEVRNAFRPPTISE